MSLSASEVLLHDGLQIPFDGWVLVRVVGENRERFLHSQLTSDVRALEVGRSQQTALLDRAGRLQAFGFLHKREDSILMLLPREAAGAAVGNLESSVIADDVGFLIEETPSMSLALGAEAVRLFGTGAAENRFPVDGWASRGFFCWGDEGLDFAALDPAELEARRVLTGLPEWGREAGPGSPIHQTSLVQTAVSFDKGCYLGQETVAKVASGRGAAKAPVLLEVSAAEISPEELVGGVFSADGKDRAGEVLSWARWEGRLYLQAAAARSLRVSGREFSCRFSDGLEIDVRAHSLPFLASPGAEEWAHELTLEAVARFSSDLEEEAIVLLERAIAVCPQHADAYEALGVIFGRHGRYEEAVALMLRLLEVDPLSVLAHTNLSLYYNQLGRIEDAEREAGEAMRAGMRQKRQESGPEASGTSEEDAAASDRKRRAEMFRQVLELDPEDALGNFGLGELFVEEGRFREAVDHLDRALATDPRYSAALLALGKAYEGAGDPAAAAETYRRGVVIAAEKGDLSTANKMQERLAGMNLSSSDW